MALYEKWFSKNIITGNPPILFVDLISLRKQELLVGRQVKLTIYLAKLFFAKKYRLVDALLFDKLKTGLFLAAL